VSSKTPTRRRGSLFFLREPLPYNTMGADTAVRFSDAHADADPDAAARARWFGGSTIAPYRCLA
jgi:hypothetical protein